MSTIVSWMGLSLVVLGMVCMRNEHKTILENQITDGQVIGIIRRSDSDDSATYAPQVRFMRRDGQAVIFETKMSSSHPGVKVGDAVKVTYPAQHPEKAGVLLFAYRFGVWYALVGVGLLLMFLGYGFKHGNNWMEKAYLSSEVVRPVDQL